MFISHTASALTVPFVEAMCVHLRHRGLLVWCDPRRKTGINKAMMTAIDSSSLFVAVVTPEYMEMVDEGETERRRVAALVGQAAKRDRDRDEKAPEYTCELQMYYATSRKHPQRIVPVLTEGAAAGGWRAVDMETLDVHVDYGEDGGFDLDEDEKEELRLAARQKAYQKELNRIKRAAGWKGTVGQILAEQPAYKQLVVSMESFHKAQRVVAQLEEDRKQQERLELKRQQKREKAERKALAAQHSGTTRRLNSRSSSRGVEEVGPAPGGVGEALDVSFKSSTELGGSVDSVDRATTNTQSKQVASDHPPPLPYPPDSLFIQQLDKLHNTIRRLLLEAASPSASSEQSRDDQNGEVSFVDGSQTVSSLVGPGGDRAPLIEVSVQEVQFLLVHLHLSAYLEEFLEREVSGLTLSYCEGIGDVEELGVRHRAKARELLHHLKGFRVTGGVPRKLLCPLQQHVPLAGAAPGEGGGKSRHSSSTAGPVAL